MVHVKKSTALMELYLKAQDVLNFIATYDNEDLIRVKRILREELPAALKTFRADLGIYPLPNDDGFCNLAALNDKLMVPSFLQHKWKGPYINLKIHSWDLNESNILVDEENNDIRYGVMVIPSYHFRDMTEIKKGVSENPVNDRYFSIVALVPNNIAKCLKMEFGSSMAVYEWDNQLSMVFYAFAPMQSCMYY